MPGQPHYGAGRMNDIAGKPLAEMPPALKQQIEWDEKTVDRMLQNQRPMTLLAVAALTAVVFHNPPVAAEGPVVATQDFALLLLAASTLIGMLSGFTGEQFYRFVARCEYGHAGERKLRLRFETAAAQILLIVGSAHFVSTIWWYIGLLIGGYGFISARIWKWRDQRLSEP